jgi:hypothetical protein
MMPVIMGQIARAAAFVGAFLLLAGLFAPILSVPGSGEVSYAQSTASRASIIGFLALFSAVLSCGAQLKHVIWPGLIAFAVLSASYLQIDQIRDEVRANADSVSTLGHSLVGASHLEWGWMPLMLGAASLILAGWLAPFMPIRRTDSARTAK